MGVTSITAPDHTVVYFTASDRETATARVTTIVVRRIPPQEPVPLRRALRQFLAQFRRHNPPPMPLHELAPGWDAASDPGGPREVLHGRALGRVRVAGQEFPFAPHGQALVLLVDDRRSAGDAVSAPVTSHTATIPPVRIAKLERGVTDAEWRRRQRAEQEQVARVVDEALARLPEVQRLVPTWRARAG